MLVSLPKITSVGLESARVKEAATRYPWLRALTYLALSVALLSFLYLKDYTRRLNVYVNQQQRIVQQLYEEQSFLVLTKKLYQQQYQTFKSPLNQEPRFMRFPNLTETIVIQ